MSGVANSGVQDMITETQPNVGLAMLQEQMLLRLADCLPISTTMQCFMNYSLGVSRAQEYIPMEPLLAPFNAPERINGRIADTRA